MNLSKEFEKNKKITLAVIAITTLLSFATIQFVYERIKTDMDSNYVMINNYAIRLQRIVQPDMNHLKINKDTVLLTQK
jgi:hypothetical protein